MRFDLAHLPTKGRHLRFALSDGWAHEAAVRALDGEVTALEGHLHASRSRGGIAVEAEVSSTAQLACHRCGDLIPVSVVTAETLVYLRPVIEPAGASTAGASGRVEVELEEADLDVGWLDADGVDASTVVEEALVLALPPRILCPAESRCAKAAVLASGPGSEGPDAPSGHPAFAKLKQLLNPSQ